MAEPTRITCQGLCSRPVAYEIDGTTYVSYIYRLGDDTEIRYRSKSEDFILEHQHQVNLAFPFASPSDDFSGSFDSDKWNIYRSGNSMGFQNGGYYRQIVGLDSTYSDTFYGSGLDSDKWLKINTTSYVDVAQDELQFVHASGLASAYSGISSKNKSFFDGDFDIHLAIDGSTIGEASTGDQYLRLDLSTTNEQNKLYVGYYVEADGATNWQTDYYRNGVWQSETTVNATQAEGYVRLARSGDTITAYYGYDREAWTSLQSCSLADASGTLFSGISALMRAEAFNGYSASADDYSFIDNDASQIYRLESTWKLIGSFDIRIPYKINFREATDSSTFEVSIVDDLRRNYSLGLRRTKTSSADTLVGTYTTEEGNETSAGIARTEASGHLRITRSGTNFTSYYWDSGSWNILQDIEDAYDTPVKLRVQSYNSDNYPISDISIGAVTVASGNAQWIDPTCYDIDVRDNGDLDLVFVTSNRMFQSYKNSNTGNFTQPEGLLIFRDEGSKIAQAYDAAITHSNSSSLLAYIDEEKAVRYAHRRASGGSWGYPEYQFPTIVASGDPTAIDADYSDVDAMFSIAWDATDGDGEYDIYYTKFGLLAGQAASGVLATARVGMWNPKVECGYFYIEDREYYLYANKQSQQVDASSGSFILTDFSKDRNILGPPIVVTDASGQYTLSDAQSTPFARTWCPPCGTGTSWIDPTPEKFRRRFDLSDRKSTKATPSGNEAYSFTIGTEYPREYYIDWGTLQSDGFYDPTFHITNGSTMGDVIVEWEAYDASGYYTVEHLDMNPLHTANTVNKFVIIKEDTPTAHEVFLESMSPYILGPSGVTKVVATVMDQYGTPVQGESVSFTMEPYKETAPTLFGSLSADLMVTSFDGSCAVVYTAPGDISGIRGSLAGGLHIIGTILSGASSDSAKIELGSSYT